MNPLILALLSPAIIGPVATALISVIKRFPVVSNVEDQGRRNLILRGLGAILSLLGVVGAFIATGVSPDLTVVSDILITLAMVFMSLTGSIGFHNLLKKN